MCAAAAARTARTRLAQSDEVYGRLCQEIVAGVLAPGEPLPDGELATRLGVSRTSVRDALRRLGQVGLVVTAPGRRTEVASIDQRTVHDAREVVAAMHELAIRTAMPHLRAADIAAMRVANERFAAAMAAGDPEAAITADDELHGVCVQVAGNAAIVHVLGQYTPVLRRVERQRFGTLSGRRSVTEHEVLIQACEDEDVEAAVTASTDLWSGLALLIDLDLPDLPDL